MQREKTANHIKIMAVARGNFLVFGFENASVRQIGERCGMTVAGIDRHCRDKADFFEQALELAVKLLPNWRRLCSPVWERHAAGARKKPCGV